MTLFDHLSYLSPKEARTLLGSRHKELLRRGGSRDIDLASQVTLDADGFVLRLSEATVTIEEDAGAELGVAARCDSCSEACEHLGAALSLILEEKLALGLAQPPDDETPLENLSEEELVTRALQDRRKRMQEEPMTAEPADPAEIWSDYTVTSHASGKSYRVALRGWERGSSYCSCPDFMTNQLGTCKHILFVEQEAKRRFPPEEQTKPYRRSHVSVYLRYGAEVELRVLAPDRLSEESRHIVEPLLGGPVEDPADLLRRIQKLERLEVPVVVHADAERYIERTLMLQRLSALTEEARAAPRNHPLRHSLLREPLLPYQLEGIAFAAGAGRAILADDMGLGKTIQAIGTAELLARQLGIDRVLVICPASVKSQWSAEIDRFSGRSRTVVVGSAEERGAHYRNGGFFTICNYEQVLRDIETIERCRWDLIVLDEGQRIKNWEAKTSRTIKSLRSAFALVLTGTPLENRLDELFSVVQFVDARRLGPAYRFFHRHRIADEKGKVLGYRNLDELRERLQPIMLRRTRAEVMKQLPERTVEVRRIRPTEEQLDVHNGHKRTVSSILAKRYISEMDLLRLQKALLMCRLAADSSYLVTKEEPGYSSKLEELGELLPELLGDNARKIVLFSEWTSMLDLVSPLIPEHCDWVRLDGSVPQKKRQALMHRFNRDPECRLFLTTNAGATGVNLQAADTVINVDLPWNPAVLEQRIARAHRMGQRRAVHVINLVTEETLEAGMLQTIDTKQRLSDSVLNPDADITELSVTRGAEELRRRLEVLVGEKPPAAIDESGRREAAAGHETATGARTAAAGSGWGAAAASTEGGGGVEGGGQGRGVAGGSMELPAAGALGRRERPRGVVQSALRFLSGLFGGGSRREADDTGPASRSGGRGDGVGREADDTASRRGPVSQARVAAARDRLARNAQRGDGGALQLTLNLPDETALDELAELIARYERPSTGERE